MTSKFQTLAIAVACCAAFAVGCKEDPPKTQEDAAPRKAAPAANATGAKGDTTSNIKIDDKIIKACGDMPAAPFAFDSAEVSPEASNVLDAVARCFITGPLKGRKLNLVGHADNRGETEYNLALGQRRAGSIQNFLANKGVENGKITTSSKGEFEATGSDEPGWAKDRRVDILLAD
jgi:peptidoglycan-associated lipoprotein